MNGDIPHREYKRPTNDKVAWTRYVNDKPVEVHPYRDQDRVWDYSENKMYGLRPGVKSLIEMVNLPIFDGVILER